ncbi:MAG: hypothetical protein LBR34_02175 [Prevotella sp.]|nr:hypothetical protein [Prevotella sp.]
MQANHISVEMIIHCSGYARVPKVTTITGLAKDGDEKRSVILSKTA